MTDAADKTEPQALVVLRLCSACPGPDWAALKRALASARFSVPVRLEAQTCMNGCSEPVSLALQGTGRATYFFGGVDPQSDVQDIVATIHAYLAADRGWIEDATSCGRLRFCLKGRVPALTCQPSVPVSMI